MLFIPVGFLQAFHNFLNSVLGTKLLDILQEYSLWNLSRIQGVIGGGQLRNICHYVEKLIVVI